MFKGRSVRIRSASRQSRPTPKKRFSAQAVVAIAVFGFSLVGSSRAYAGSGPGAAGKLAAPVRQVDVHLSYGLDIARSLPRPICVGQAYPLPVKAVARGSTSPNPELLRHSDLAGVAIDATVADPGVASISPRTARTGWNALDSADDVLIADFTVEGKKPGKTTLYFEAQFEQGYIHDEYDIEVAYCKYQVTMTLDWEISESGGSAWTYGTMDTKIVGDPQQYSGSGDFKFIRNVSLPGCTFSFSDFQVPVSISGSMDDDGANLQLDFEYGSTTSSGSAACEGFSGSGSAAFNPSNGGVKSARFPVTGGSKSFGSQGGFFGKLTITVTPISGGYGS